MPHERLPLEPRTNWAYAYELVPSQPHHRLRAIQALVDRAHREAAQVSRAWEGRIVQDNRITHILVVSDSPDRDADANRQLQAGLRDLDAGFCLTVAVAVRGMESPGAGGEGPR